MWKRLLYLLALLLFIALVSFDIYQRHWWATDKVLGMVGVNMLGIFHIFYLWLFLQEGVTDNAAKEAQEKPWAPILLVVLDAAAIGFVVYLLSW